MDPIPDDLIMKAAAGDVAAFEKIYRATSPYVYRIAMGVVRNAHDADEVTQEVYVRAHRNLKGFGFRSAFTTWLYRITMNAALNACSRRERDNARYLHDEGALERAIAPEVADEASVSGGESGMSDRAMELLGVLSPDHRSCIVLRELEGMSYEQMADALHININTVRTRLKRAREALIEYVRKEVRSDEL